MIQEPGASYSIESLDLELRYTHVQNIHRVRRKTSSDSTVVINIVIIMACLVQPILCTHGWHLPFLQHVVFAGMADVVMCSRLAVNVEFHQSFRLQAWDALAE